MKSKKGFIILALMLAGVLVFAAAASAEIEVWHPVNQVEVGWDAVTQTVDGAEITTGSVEYDVRAAGIDRSSPQVLWRGPETAATVTLPAEGKFLLGVKAYRVVDGEDVSESEISWSDDASVVKAGLPFGVIHYRPLAPATGFGKE